MNPATNEPRAGRWRQAAGAGAVVAVLIVSQASPTSASTASPPTATQTLSTGAYAWHVATTTSEPATNEQARIGPLHGEFPTVDGDGTVQIRRWQWGAVAAFSADSVTVVSDDGFVSDYRVGPAAGVDLDLRSVAVGSKVTVVGTVRPAETTAAVALPARPVRSTRAHLLIS